MAIMSYVLMFCSAVCSSLQYFIPALAGYKRFALGVAIIVTVILLRYLLNTRFGISMGVFVTGIIMLTITIMYFATEMFYKEVAPVGAENYEGFKLAWTGQAFPCVLVAAVAATEERIQDGIKRLAPFVGLLFTFIAFVAAFNPSDETSGGYAMTSNGLNYQTISYMAAYASALMEYFILTQDDIVHFGIVKSVFAKYIAIALIVVNALSVLLAGGRGGFVEYVIFLLLTLYLSFKRKKLTAEQLFRWSFLIVLIIVVGYFVFKYAAASTISTNGFERIQRLINGEGDDGRAFLRAQALRTFKEKPIFGHGFGSVFLLLNFFTHNFFTDALVETGIVGTIVWVVVIIKFIIKCLRIIRFDISNSLWMYIFLSGFIMSLFSGYYLTHYQMCFGMAFVFNYMERNNLEIKDRSM